MSNNTKYTININKNGWLKNASLKLPVKRFIMQRVEPQPGQMIPKFSCQKHLGIYFVIYEECTNVKTNKHTKIIAN